MAGKDIEYELTDDMKAFLKEERAVEQVEKSINIRNSKDNTLFFYCKK